MSVSSALYTLLIGPLELFFEILYAVANRIIGNPGLSIIFLSLAMNFLVLPLYKMADEIQAEEQATEAKLRHWVTHIKKTFQGDERFMMLQTYYRQNGYKPTDPLKGSVSLVLEIPFFLAAYNFLSDLQLLQGTAFGPIRDLGAPDGLLVIGSVAVNLLPILMTAINLISSAIYTKGSSLRTKIQLYVMAGLFLVLLYDSPAGLVFYWTLNNLFSLIKNIFMKLRKPGLVLGILASVVSVCGIGYVLTAHPMYSAKGQALACALLLLLQLPLVLQLAGRNRPARTVQPVTKKERGTYFAGTVFLTVLMGLLIPAGVIHASPLEFLNPVTNASPLQYLLHSGLTAAGVFLVWCSMFYFLATDSAKRAMSCGVCAVSVIAVVNFLFFGRNSGNMSATLVFDVEPMTAIGTQLLNLGLAAVLAGAVYVIWQKKQELLRGILMTTALAALVMSVVHMGGIQKVWAEKTEQLQQSEEAIPELTLSREGKNVVILMMDRGIGAHVPFLLTEKPELQAQFAGFTYYPNTISFGGYTNFGSPALYGGYEYTPEELNKRDTESLESKQNEALTVLPRLFSENGFVTTVTDPPCAGYDWIPDLTIYDEYPGIRAFNTLGRFESDPVAAARRQDHKRNRNFFCYSLYKTTPALLQSYVYDGGLYNELGRMSRQTAGTDAAGANPAFLKAYTVLQNLPNITKITDTADNTFLMMANDTTHEPTFLQTPDYVPVEFPNNAAYDAEHADRFRLGSHELHMSGDFQMQHYHVDMAAFLQLGQWFDYLRQQDVYDNTRIIIVSDHGLGFGGEGLIPLPFEDGETGDSMYYNPMLLVKDFGSTELTMNMDFMTNADTPVLAMAGLIENPVNPFTRRPITGEEKLAGPQHILCSYQYDIYTNNGNAFLPDPWYSVEDNIFEAENWQYLGVR